MDGYGSVASNNYVDLYRDVTVPTGGSIASVEFFSNDRIFMTTYNITNGNRINMRLWSMASYAYSLGVNDYIKVHYK